MRIDRDDPGPQAVILDRATGELGRIARSYFDVDRGIVQGEQPIDRDGIEGGEGAPLIQRGVGSASPAWAGIFSSQVR